MTFTFRPASRDNVGLLLGLAGSSGSGKTYTALRLAKGMAGDRTFAVIDTEAGRAKHYADLFRFDHGDLKPPFTPAAYADAIAAADGAGYSVIIVDSCSHEHAGEGGILDMQEAEYARLGARDSVKMLSWVKPKGEHRRMVSRLLQVRAHLILCFRAEEKIEMVKGADGKIEVRKKQTTTGLDGWVPICEKNLPYELTASFLLMASRPGIPLPIKLQEQHKPFFPLDQVIDEMAGVRVAAWANGTSPSAAVSHPAEPAPSSADRDALKGRIATAAQKVAMPPHVRQTLARQCLGTGTIDTADLSALEDLLIAVRCWKLAE